MATTTQLELQSQRTRLLEPRSVRGALQVLDGILTLYDAIFQWTYTRGKPLTFGLQTTTRSPSWVHDFKVELFPLHSPLLGESLLVSFPPLNNMLKFGGYPRFISDHIAKGNASIPNPCELGLSARCRTDG